MARLLIVDDEAALRRALRRTLERAGHEILEAPDVASARELLSCSEAIELVFCDVGLPGESGLELVRSLAGSDIAVVMLTGLDDPAVADSALAIGAYAYLVKPLGPNEVLINVASALRRRDLELAHREYLRELENKVVLRTAALRDAVATLQRNEPNARLVEQEIIDRLVAALTLRSEETGAHMRRVGLYAAQLARATTPSAWSEHDIRVAAMLHDVGKIGIPDSVLLKPGRLTTEEFETMKRHCRLGESLLKGGESRLLTLAAEVALTHHERWDGTGYPDGLAGEEIPLSGRIVTLADVFDALTSRRVYRGAICVEDAIRIIEHGQGTQFDPALVSAFISSREVLEAIRSSNPDVTPAESVPRNPRPHGREGVTGVRQAGL